MKIAFTVTDAAQSIHVGGDVERITSVIEISDEILPDIVRRHFANQAWAKEAKGRHCYSTLTITLVQ